MYRRFVIWIKRFFGKLFRRPVNYTEVDLNVDITRRLHKLACDGRINIYNGSIQGLRAALGDSRSFVYVIQVTNPVDAKQLVQFDEYIKSVRTVADTHD